jgi:hypothetical protein
VGPSCSQVPLIHDTPRQGLFCNRDSQRLHRFIDKARELGCDEDETAFEKRLRKIAKDSAAGTRKKEAPEDGGDLNRGFWGPYWGTFVMGEGTPITRNDIASQGLRTTPRRMNFLS